MSNTPQLRVVEPLADLPDGPQLEVIDTPDKRKARGAFFTPESLTRYMVRWALRSGSDRILEPSCGEAAFLVAAAHELRAQGALFPELHGFDVHEPSLRTAGELLTELGVRPKLGHSSFFEVAADPAFDVILGNPPYVRYQGFTGDDREQGLRVAAEQGVRLSKLANAWAAFVVHASGFLRPQGRLALVLPAVLLSANYAGPVRKFLAERFGEVRVVMFRDRVFPGVLEEVVLLLCSGQGPTTRLQVARLQDDRALQGEIPWRDVELNGDTSKWSRVLLTQGEAEHFDQVAARFATLEQWGHVELGTVTGNNRYFTLSAEEAQRWGIPASELLRVSPAGSRHLRGLELGPKYLDALTDEGRATYLFYPPAKAAELSDAARRYIEDGEARDIHQAYKCRVRSPWWRVPVTPTPDLIFTYMSGDAPRLVANTARARVLNSVHGVRLAAAHRELGTELLPVAMLNSVTLLGAELVGRSYGGGILKLEPREARRLPLPTPEDLEGADELRALPGQLGKALRKGDLLDVVRRVDDVLLARHMRIPRPEIRRVRAAWLDLKGRREARGKKKP